MHDIHVIVVTPEATVVDAKTKFVAVPFYDGEVGIANDHAPLIGRLGCGELRFESDGETVRYFIDGGFVQIADNVVSIMSNRALSESLIDAGEAQQQLEAAMSQPAAGDEVAERQKQIDRARAMLRVTTRSVS